MHARRSLRPLALRGHRSRRLGAGMVVLAALLTLALAGAVEAARVAAPQPSGPPSGAANPELPPFVWRPSRGAESYEFQIAADRGFNSSVRGLRNNRFDTANTRATITTAGPERHLLVARPGGDEVRPGVGVVDAPLCAQGVDNRSRAARAGERRARLLPRSAADPLLGAGAARGEVPRLARYRPGSGHADRGQDGRDVGDELRPVADPVGRQGQDLLLGRDPARRAGQPRHAVAHRLLRVGVAVADRRPSSRMPAPSRRRSTRSSRGSPWPGRRGTSSR